MRARGLGQISLEFLMTYGWAITIMLAVVAILFYLGAFSPPAPTFCEMQAGFACRGFKITAAGGVATMTLNLIQTTGHPISINRILCTANDADYTNSSHYSNYTDRRVYSGNVEPLSFPCYNSASIPVSVPGTGDYFHGTVYMHYTDEETNLEHMMVGQVGYKVE